MHRGYCPTEHNIDVVKNIHFDLYTVHCNYLEIITPMNNILDEQELEVQLIASEEELVFTVYP